MHVVTTRHFIIATAGHVDHGKSALVKALTGTDPDRLPEEKARGITIDLGFAHLALPSPLGVARGVVALSKIDLAADEARTVAGVREQLRGSPLEGAPVIPTSSSAGGD